MENQNHKNDTMDKMEKLLSKYISVWLWSILFGGATTLTFSLANVRSYEKWGILSLVIGIIMAFAITFVIIAWLTLFRFLKAHIVPGLFLGDKRVFELKNLERSGRYLTMSFYALVLSGITRLMMELVKSFFDILY